MGDSSECSRCGSEKDFSSFKNDPRWGKTCGECHSELIEIHGRPSQGEQKNEERIRGDGQPESMASIKFEKLILK